MGALALTGAATLRKAVAASQRSGCDRHFEEAEELEAALDERCKDLRPTTP